VRVPAGWVKLPRAWNAARSGLSSSAQAVYVDLLLNADHRTWIGSLSLRGIAGRCCLSKSTVACALAALADAGIINYESGVNQYAGTRYSLTLNADAVQSEGQRDVQAETRHPDSTSGQRDTARTARAPLPATTRPLERLRSIQERSRSGAPPDLLPSESDGAPQAGMTRVAQPSQEGWTPEQFRYGVEKVREIRDAMRAKR
jgi:predicted transcriptional regulator